MCSDPIVRQSCRSFVPDLHLLWLSCAVRTQFIVSATLLLVIEVLSNLQNRLGSESQQLFVVESGHFLSLNSASFHRSFLYSFISPLFSQSEFLNCIHKSETGKWNILTVSSVCSKYSLHYYWISVLCIWQCSNKRVSFHFCIFRSSACSCVGRIMFSITINVCVRSPFLVSFSIYHSLDSTFHYREYLKTYDRATGYQLDKSFTFYQPVYLPEVWTRGPNDRFFCHFCRGRTESEINYIEYTSWGYR